MQELTEVLETRCVDVFEFGGNDRQLRRALLARGLFTHYFSKVYGYLFKCFRCGFELDWSYVSRDAFAAAFAPIARRLGTIRIANSDGLAYYFRRAAAMLDGLALTTANRPALSAAFTGFPAEFTARMPKELEGARTFRGDEMTMAGLLVFLAPLLSVNDCRRLVDDTTMVFATNISYYQGLHTESLTAALERSGSAVMEPFRPFFKGGRGTPLNRLAQVLFGDKWPYARLEKEEEGTYAFSLDLSRWAKVAAWRLVGTIKDEGADFLVTYDPIKSKVDMALPAAGCAVRFDKSAIDALIPYAEKIPACTMALSFAIIWQNLTLTGESLRTVASGLTILETGANWFDDRDRFDEVEKPLYRTALCLAPALDAITRRLSREPDPLKRDRALAAIARIRPKIRYFREIWAYDVDYDSELSDGNGNFAFFAVDDLAAALAAAYQLLRAFGDSGEVFTQNALKGTQGFMALLVAGRFTPALEASRRIMDPLSVPLAEWQKRVRTGEETIAAEDADPEVTDTAIAAMAPCGIVMDAFVYADADYQNAAPGTKRYFTGLTRVHVTARKGTVFVKGKDTGLRELVFYVTDDQTDIQSVAGPLGEPPVVVSKTRQLGFVEVIEMRL